MGLTFSTNINVDKEAVTEMRGAVNDFTQEMKGSVDKVIDEYKQEKEEIKSANKEMRENVDKCVKLYLDSRLLGCNDLLKFGSKKGKCNELEYELLQCMTDYSKFLAERY
jgi:hypothetical protein